MIAGLLSTVQMGPRTPALAWILLVLMMDQEDHTITSIADGVHHTTGPHSRGEAVDIRSHDLVGMDATRARQRRLAALLGPAFTVLLEPYDVPGDDAPEHLHLQLAPGVSWAAADVGVMVQASWNTLPPVKRPAGPTQA